MSWQEATSGPLQTVAQMAQVTAAQLRGMSPDEIVEAQGKGRLNALLGLPLPGEGTP